MKNKKLFKALLIAAAIVLAGVIFTFVKDSDTDAQEVISESSEDLADDGTAPDETGELSEEETDPDEVCVHVCGAVNSPGVFYLNAGSRIYEAVEMAGGLSDDAAEEYVNLAEVVQDGQQIYIPTQQEAIDEGLEIGALYSSAEDDDGLVNINTATSQELQSLPGIGESKAQAIINYREDNGDFASIEDITNVSGIGESTYENIKDYITV